MIERRAPRVALSFSGTGSVMSGGRACLLWLAGVAACHSRSPVVPCPIEVRHQRHACVHAVQGPFASLDATVAANARLSEAHTVYTVRLGEGEGGGFMGVLPFRAARSGCWAFFTSGVTALQRQPGCRGADIAAPLRVNACLEWTSAFTIELARDEEAILNVHGPSPLAVLLFERLGDGIGASSPLIADCGVDAAPEARHEGGVADVARDGVSGSACRSSGPCISDDECCEYCHDGDHCH